MTRPHAPNVTAPREDGTDGRTPASIGDAASIDDTLMDAALAALRTSPDTATVAPARAAFLRAVDLERRPAARTFDRLWTRGLEPALFGVSSLAYLVWLGVTLSPA